MFEKNKTITLAHRKIEKAEFNLKQIFNKEDKNSQL